MLVVIWDDEVMATETGGTTPLNAGGGVVRDPGGGGLVAHQGVRIRPVSSMVGRVFLADCMEFLGTIPDGSIDMVLCDLPYGTTRNSWDSVLDLGTLWGHYWRVLKPSGVVVLTAAQPFTSTVVASNFKDFKVEWIWEKSVGSGQLNISHQPLRMHESVLVFYRKRATYNEQLSTGAPYSISRRATFKGPGYNPQRASKKDNSGWRHATTILRVPNPRVKGGHPTQKPVELFEYLIRTYSNPGEVVLDHCIGAGTTAVACIRCGREFIGVDSNEEYVNMAVNNIVEARTVAAGLAEPSG